MAKTKYTARFKFDRVMESIKKGSISNVSRQYGFGANLLSKWRSEFLNGGHQFFDTKKDREVEQLKREKKQLEQLIGKKEIELNLIKNFADFYESQNGK